MLTDIVDDSYLLYTTPLAPDTVLPAYTLIGNTPSVFVFPPVIGYAPIYSVTYNVAFPTDQITSAHFKLVVSDYDGSVFNYLFVFTYLSIEVNLFKTSNLQTASVGTPVKTILRATDTGRYDVFKIIYVDKDNSLFNFSVSPQVVPVTNQQHPHVYLYSLATPAGTFGN